VAGRVGRPGPRGLDPREIVVAALALMDREGPEGFSVRKLGQAVGCDPMAVLYHFGSKDGLERAVADAVVADLRQLDPDAPWRDRLRGLAFGYRELALRHPRAFPLLLRFWVTGPADHRAAEALLGALADAGLDDEGVRDAGFGWYAAVLGLAAAEAGGLLRPATPEVLAEIAALPPDAFPQMTRLRPAFAAQEAGRAFATTVEVLIDGVERRAGGGS